LIVTAQIFLLHVGLPSLGMSRELVNHYLAITLKLCSFPPNTTIYPQVRIVFHLDIPQELGLVPPVPSSLPDTSVIALHCSTVQCSVVSCSAVHVTNSLVTSLLSALTTWKALRSCGKPTASSRRTMGWMTTSSTGSSP
jgi:hypothetical protein